MPRARDDDPVDTGKSISTDQANYYGWYRYGVGHTGKDRGRTLEVGSLMPNGFGLYDTHGNAREWVEDCWNASYRGAPDDGSAWMAGDCSRRVVRGGAWNSVPWLLRAAYRSRVQSVGRSDSLGFRVARTLR